MIKITPQEDIDIISKRTDFGYKVLQIGINERTHKVEKYLIKNQGYEEWWNSDNFTILNTVSIKNKAINYKLDKIINTLEELRDMME